MAGYTYKSLFLLTLAARGFIHQCTDLEGLDALLDEGEKTGKPVPAYIGFDCTAPSLHVGSLLQIMALHWFQQSGHKPIVLMGGGTTKVGDPSGKDESRKLLTDAEIEKNKSGIQQVFSKFLKFEKKPDPSTSNAIMVDNAEWLDGLKYIEFLRDYGRHFSVNHMLSMDSVKLRLERESHLSFLEFNYMVLQAYDFVELNRRYGCQLQMGGSDQWGNIVNGVDLHHKKFSIFYATTPETRGVEEEKARILHIKKPVFGLTTPLITTSSGAKMGKTAQGAVWLDQAMLSPYDYWQFWRNTEDADVGRFLRFFTTLPLQEIEKLEKLPGAKINEAKKILADAATTLCHGNEAARQARETAEKTFEQGGIGASLPEIAVDRTVLSEGIKVFELFTMTALAESNGEAKRLIRGGGGKINDVKIEDENRVVNLADISAEGIIKLSAGKKKHALVKLRQG